MDYHIDAKNKILGRVASEISQILQGKRIRTMRANRVSTTAFTLKNYGEVVGDRQEARAESVLSPYRLCRPSEGDAARRAACEESEDRDPRSRAEDVAAKFFEPAEIEESDIRRSRKDRN